MSDSEAETRLIRRSRFPAWRSLLAWAVLFFGLVVLLQWLGGTYQSEFGSEPDEAAHYITGLCVRDYVAAGCPGNPLTFAKQYYDHYPKVALGHWPPFFYIIQAAWTLPFSPSRGSVLLLMAWLTTMVATLIFAFLKKEFGTGKALVGTLLFLSLPLVQKYSGAVMTEIPVALLVFVAAVFFGRYLEREQTSDALAFGGFAALAVLTKTSGLALVFVPPLGVLLTRKSHLLKRASFWYPAAMVGLLGGSWMVLTWKLASDGMAEDPFGWAFTHKAIPYYAQKLYQSLGLALVLFGCPGIVMKLFFLGRGESPSGRWAAMGALLAGVLALHVIVPAGYEARHLTPVLAPAVMFAVAGLDSYLRGARTNKLYLAFLCFAVVAFFVTQPFGIVKKGYEGFGAVAAALQKNIGTEHANILIVSDARGEGMFISEMAMSELRPGHFVKRGSKELASSSWSGGHYQAKITDEASLVSLLRTNAVRFVVVDESLSAGQRKEYHTLVRQTVENNRLDFRLVDKFPIERAGQWHTDAISLYQFGAE